MDKSLITIALFLAAVAIILIARSVHPGKNQQGSGLQGYADENESGTDVTPGFNVATFNIQTGKDIDGHRDISASAKVLETAHLAAVQEVYGAGWLNKLGFGQSQTKELAQQGKFNHLFAATRYRWFREQRGNTTLSKLPVREWEVRMLPDRSRKSPRNMTIVHFSWRGEDAVFINTHLHTGKGRLEQLETVLAEFMKHSRVILAGDFNTRGNAPLLRTILDDGTVTDAIRAAGLVEEGDDRIDWILTRGFEVVSGREQPKGISDHPFFEVTLR